MPLFPDLKSSIYKIYLVIHRVNFDVFENGYCNARFFVQLQGFYLCRKLYKELVFLLIQKIENYTMN